MTAIRDRLICSFSSILMAIGIAALAVLLGVVTRVENEDQWD